MIKSNFCKCHIFGMKFSCHDTYNIKNNIKITKINLTKNVKTINVKLAVKLTLMHQARKLIEDFLLFCRRNRLSFNLHYMMSSPENFLIFMLQIVLFPKE